MVLPSSTRRRISTTLWTRKYSNAGVAVIQNVFRDKNMTDSKVAENSACKAGFWY